MHQEKRRDVGVHCDITINAQSRCAQVACWLTMTINVLATHHSDARHHDVLGTMRAAPVGAKTTLFSTNASKQHAKRREQWLAFAYRLKTLLHIHIHLMKPHQKIKRKRASSCYAAIGWWEGGLLLLWQDLWKGVGRLHRNQSVSHNYMYVRYVTNWYNLHLE